MIAQLVQRFREWADGEADRADDLFDEVHAEWDAIDQVAFGAIVGAILAFLFIAVFWNLIF